MLSHELRNPLACLRNALLLKELEGEDGDSAGETHAMMERQVDQLAGIVDDLLDVSRIVRGRFELRKSRVAFGDIVDRAVDTIRPVIESHGHELAISLPPEPLFVEGDSTRLIQVLTNLLENAALYQKGPGKIWVSVRREGDWLSSACGTRGLASSLRCCLMSSSPSCRTNDPWRVPRGVWGSG